MGDHVLFLAVSLCSFDGVEGGREGGREGEKVVNFNCNP